MIKKYKEFDIEYHDEQGLFGKVICWEISNDWLNLASGNSEDITKKELLIEMKDRINEYWEDNKKITQESIELVEQILKQLKSKDVRKIRKLADNLDSNLQHGFQEGYWK